MSSKLIILIGFPKCGTSSFNKLFTLLKFKTYHWKYGTKFIGELINNNFKNQKRLLSFLDKDIESSCPYVCLTQMDLHLNDKKGFFPQQTHIDQLYHENRDALFILNYRSPERLLRSFKKWGAYDRRFMDYTPELFQNIDCGLSDDERVLKMITNHYDMMIQYFSDKPCKFVKFDIENDSISILSEFIDLKDYKYLPHENKSR